MNAVETEDLTRSFGPIVAVDRLTFSVRKGELFGIVGPDGAGKTTTLRMLAGVLRPTSGRALVAGIDVGTEPEDVKPRIAYMAQRFGLYDDLTVEENLAFYADLYRVPKEARPSRLARLYEFSRLGDFTNRLAGNLSGGMKQKLSLSCCLVHHPEVVLLDEPTFGVDPISRRELWLILHEMVREGVTILVSTSYLDEAERCDRILLMNQGRALALDAPAALQSALDGALFAVRTDRPREARDVLRASNLVATATLFGDTVHALVAPDRTPADLTAILAAGGIATIESTRIEPSLEDVFIHRIDSGGTPHA